MAEIHDILTESILPSLKRYANATEPIREVSRVRALPHSLASETDCASQFWMKVFQMASLEPEDDEYNGTHHESVPSESSQIKSNQEASREGPTSEHSFADAAIASTPIEKHAENVKGSSAEASWIASIESPHERMQRQLAQLTIDENAPDTQTGHYGKGPFHSQTIQPPRSGPPRFIPPDPNNASSSLSFISNTNTLQSNDAHFPSETASFTSQSNSIQFRPPSSSQASVVQSDTKAQGRAKPIFNLRAKVLQRNAIVGMGTPSPIPSSTPPTSELSKVDVKKFVPIFKRAQVQGLSPAKPHIATKRAIDEAMRSAYFELQSNVAPGSPSRRVAFPFGVQSSGSVHSFGGLQQADQNTYNSFSDSDEMADEPGAQMEYGAPAEVYDSWDESTSSIPGPNQGGHTETFFGPKGGEGGPFELKAWNANDSIAEPSYASGVPESPTPGEKPWSY